MTSTRAPRPFLVRRSAELAGAILTLSGIFTIVGVAFRVGAAPANTPYELYCPMGSVGGMVLNNVSTSASITPAAPSVGSTFQVTDYQTEFTIPAALVNVWAGLGNTVISGSATPPSTPPGRLRPA